MAESVIEGAKMAGVYVFGGQIEESVDLVWVSADGSVGRECMGTEIGGIHRCGPDEPGSR